MNNFERFGIQHLSPSTCNLFAASPAAFVLQKLLGVKSQVGAAAHRGTAVEAGIAKRLVEGCSVEEAIAETEATFARLTALLGDPRKDKELAALPDMVRTGLFELEPYGKPTGTQGKVEWKIEGLPVPMIGFYDFEWENHGILIDLKTTHALPSKISTSHARQVALYHAARKISSARLCYVTSKKSAVYLLENPQEHLRSLENIARRISNFLNVSSDPKELANIVVPDVDSFYFNDAVTRQAAFEVWGV